MSAADVNPAALSRTDSISSMASAAGTVPRQAPTSTSKIAKTPHTAPRVEYEQLYTTLRTALGDNWKRYYGAISGYIQGKLNQHEFSCRVDSIVSADATIEHAHNQFISAIIFNLTRESPDHGVASFVSANDEPSTTSKTFSGDAAALRTKTEVKNLPPRERRRLKRLLEKDANIEVDNMLFLYHRAKKVKLPDTMPPSAGGLNKTNWELEIKKRYNLPLFAETFEFPDPDVLHARMQPICFEEALPRGCQPAVGTYMSVAVETYLKEVLSDVFIRTRSNPPTALGMGVQTHRYKRQLEREEDAWLKGELKRETGSGLLPVEAKEAQSRKQLDMSDVRLALEVSGAGLGHFQLIINSVMTNYLEGELEEEKERMKLCEVERRAQMAKQRPHGRIVNGIDAPLAASSLESKIDWNLDPGGAGRDEPLEKLNSLLDDCLATES